MSNDVLVVEIREADAGHAGENGLHLDEPRVPGGGQVDLRHVAGDDHLRVEAQTREKHLHLLGRAVLRLVENDERVVERPPAHVRERRDLDGALLHEAPHLLAFEHVVERIVERT